jgi:hypothetical protein
VTVLVEAGVEPVAGVEDGAGDERGGRVPALAELLRQQREGACLARGKRRRGVVAEAVAGRVETREDRGVGGQGERGRRSHARKVRPAPRQVEQRRRLGQRILAHGVNRDEKDVRRRPRPHQEPARDQQGGQGEAEKKAAPAGRP